MHLSHAMSSKWSQGRTLSDVVPKNQHAVYLNVRYTSHNLNRQYTSKIDVDIIGILLRMFPFCSFAVFEAI